MTNALLSLHHYGQSLWCGDLGRELVTSGGLRRLRDRDGVKGAGLDLAHFARAVSGTREYDSALAAADTLALSAEDLAERLMLEVVRGAADALRPVYVRTRRRDGFVALPLNPWAAHSPAETVASAMRLAGAVRCENVLMALPATPAGLAALTELTTAGVSTAITHVYSPLAYRAVAEARLTGLERRAAAGLPLQGVAGVAALPLGRLDAAVRQSIEARLRGMADSAAAAELLGLADEAAPAVARCAHAAMESLHAGPRWSPLAAMGATPLRLVYSGRGVAGGARRELKLVEELVGPDTIQSLSPGLLDAFATQGRPRLALREGLDRARVVLAALARAGVPLERLAASRVDAAVDESANDYDRLVAAVARKRRREAPQAFNPGLHPMWAATVSSARA